MKIDIKLEYSDFLQLLVDGVAEMGNKRPLILEIRVSNEGKLDVIAEEVSCIDSMFEGLLELKTIISSGTSTKSDMETSQDSSNIDTRIGIGNVKNEITYKKEYMSSAPPIYVHFDTDSTIPSLSTSLDLDDLRPYESSEARMSQIRDKAEQIFCKKFNSNETVSLEDLQLVPLMYNPTQVVMNAGHWIPAIYRNGKWIIPHISAGGKNDVLRMFLLQTQIVIEKKVLVHAFQPYEEILLISASEGIRRAVVVGRPPKLLDKYLRDRKSKEKSNISSMEEKRAAAAAAAEKRSGDLIQKSLDNGRIPNTGLFKLRKLHW